MRIGYVSTYPPIECGIATYTSYLNEAVYRLHNETFVISQSGAQGRNVFPVYEPGSTSIATQIYDLSTKMTPDIIHIQHEFGLYGLQRGVQIIDLIVRYRMVRVPVATTLHTVYSDFQDDKIILVRLILNESSLVIVHENYQKEILLKLFGSDYDTRIWVIPHGVRDSIINKHGKRKLELEGKKVILLCGYFRPTKGFHKIVKIFPQVVEKIPNAILLIAGKSRGIEYMDYQREFFEMINQSPVTDRILVLRGQFPQKTFDTILSAADLVCLPYEKSGQSGILAQSFAHRTPVVTSDLVPFRAWLDRSHGGLLAKDDDKMAEAIIKILSDDDLRKQLEKNITDYVDRDVSWKHVAKSHIEAYQSVIRVPYGKARHVFWE
jgi:glycosyltransferase involved in cell wall biosynthesis